MARSNIAVYKSSPAGVELDPWTTIVQAEGAQFDAGVDGKRVLAIRATAGEAVTATILAGRGMNSGIGNLELPEVEDGATLIAGPFESERFEQADGKIYVDFADGADGAVVVIAAP
jgi:hypothetical protein